MLHALVSHQTAMPLSAVEKASRRYRDCLEKGLEPPPPRTAANMALLEEVRTEVRQAKMPKLAVQSHAHVETPPIVPASPPVQEGQALRQQFALPTSTDQRALPPEGLHMLAIHALGEACALELEARRRECDLQFEAAEARCVALKDEQARLAPVELRHFRQTYERLAVQHAWPALPEGSSLPVHVLDSLAWFFSEDRRFRVALYAKMKSVMQKEGIKPKCSGCQHNVEKLGGAPHMDLWTPGSWDLSCARHKVLSAVNETRCEVALRIEWAEQALQFAASQQQKRVEHAEQLRLASMAREAEARQERKRQRSVAYQARREINPKASKCRKCEEADFAWGGLCPDHEKELQLIEARLSKESVVLLSDSAAASSDSE